MTGFLVIGGIGVALLVLALVLGDHVDGILEAFEAGEWFTGAGLAGFLGALGFVGALVLGTTDNMAAAIAAGVVAGLAVGAGVAWLTLRLRHAGTGTAPSRASLLGRTGIVVSDIPADGFGEIRVSGRLDKVNARAERPLPAGTEVWVVESLSATSVLVQAVRD